MVIIILVTATSVQFIQPTVFPLVSPGIAARKQEQKPQSRTLFILFMSHGLFVSNRSGSLNRSLFHCYRSQRELDASRSVCTSLSLFLGFSFRGQKSKEHQHPPPVGVHPCRGSPTRIFLLLSPPPLVTLAPSLTSSTSRWRKRRRASIVHHPPHARMHACMHARVHELGYASRTTSTGI